MILLTNMKLTWLKIPTSLPNPAERVATGSIYSTIRCLAVVRTGHPKWTCVFPRKEIWKKPAASQSSETQTWMNYALIERRAAKKSLIVKEQSGFCQYAA